MQHKILTTLFMSALSFMNSYAADDVKLTADNFSPRLLEVLKKYDINKDGVLQVDELEEIKTLTVTGSGKTDEVSLKGIEYLFSTTDLVLKDLKYSGDFCFVFADSNGQLFNSNITTIRVYGCELGDIQVTPTSAEIKEYSTKTDFDIRLWQLHLLDNTTFGNIVTPSEVTRTITKKKGGTKDITISCTRYKLAGCQIDLDNLDSQESYSSSIPEHYLYVTNCKSLKNIDASTAVSIGIDKVPALESITWNATSQGYTTIEPSSLSNLLGVVSESRIPVRKNKGISSVAELKFTNESDPIDLTKYGLKHTRIDKLSSNAFIDGNNIYIDWSKAVDGKLTVTYQYNVFDITDSGDNYMGVTINAKLVAPEPEDKEAPVITVTGDQNADGTYKAGVTVNATDDIKVTSLTVNGEEVVDKLPYAIADVEGNYTIVAADASGKSSDKKIIIKHPEPEDKEAPVITVTGDQNADGTYKAGVTVNATDDIKVTSLTVNGEEVVDKLPYNIADVEGVYTIVAADASGKSSDTKITIKHPEPEDKEAPVITVTGDQNADGTYKAGVTVNATDDIKVTSLTVNGEEVVDKLPYNIADVEGAYTIVAADASGKSSEEKFTIKHPEPEDKEAPTITITGSKNADGTYSAGVTVNATDDIKVTSLTINGEEVVDKLPYNIADIEGDYTIIAADASGKSSEEKFTIKHIATPVVPEKPYIEPTDVATSVFRKVHTNDFNGIEVLSKDELEIVIYTEDGTKVDIEKVKVSDHTSRIALPAGKYRADFGQTFRNIAIEIE